MFTLALPLSITLFIFSTIGVVFSSIYISRFADIFEEKSKKNTSAIIGMILGIVTASPEICITTYYVLFGHGESNVTSAVANSLGGNIIHVMLLGALTCIFIKNIKYLKSSLTEFVSVSSLIFLYILFIIGFTIPDDKLHL
jgi:Ca2+/Na+ antiporter